MTKVIVVNGPNLGRLGVRQPDVYGRQDLDTLRKLCTEWGKDLGLEVEVRQTDDEAEMVHWMHQAADEKTPVVMNPAAFTHYSYALADAAHDPDFLALLERDLKPFLGKERSDVKEDVPLLALAREGDLTALVRQVGPALLARLARGE